MNGHNNAILQVCWSQDDTKLYSCSADKTICVWDLFESKRLKKLKGHEGFVNSIDATKKGPEMIVSGGDDNSIFLWDLRTKKPVLNEKFKFQITSVAFNSTGETIFAGGIDNQVKIYDIRKRQTENVLIGHTDTITGLALSNDGNFLLSNSMDHSIRCWDIRPFVQGNRCVKVFQGAVHNFEKNLLRVAWSRDDAFISAGSADR
jgi:Prp8 binding protein